MSDRRTPHTTTAAPSPGAVPFPIPVVGLGWQARAACLAAVDAGEVPASTWDDHVDGERRGDRELRHHLAAGYCAACPVAEACLTDYARGYGGGFRAGYPLEDTSDHRHEHHAPPAVPTPRGSAECGSPRGARAHRYRAEDVCPACAEAERAENRDRMRRKRAELAELEVPA